MTRQNPFHIITLSKSESKIIIETRFALFSPNITRESISDSSSVTTKNTFAKLLNFALNFLPLLGLVILGLATVIRAYQAINLNYDWLIFRPNTFWRPGVEGLMLDETIRVRRGIPLYLPITDTSFISAPYPPVFYHLSAFVMNFSGENMFAGRFISFISALGCSLLVALLVIAENRKKWKTYFVGITVGAGLITFPPFIIWASRNRGDVLMVFFFLAGALALLSWNPAKSRMPYFLPAISIICFVLAVYTKQTVLLAVLPVVVWLAWHHFKAAILYAFGLGGGLLLPFIALEIITKGEFFRHIVYYHAVPWSFGAYRRWFGAFLNDKFWWLLIAIGWILAGLIFYWRTRPRKNRYLKEKVPLSPVIAGVSLVSSFTSGVLGGDHNHFLLASAGVCWAAGSGLAFLIINQKQNWVKLSALVVSLVLAAQLWLGWDGRKDYYGFDLKKPTPVVQERLERLINYVRQVDGAILTEEVAITALAGKLVPYNDLTTMGMLIVSDKWDDKALAEEIRQKKFSLILLPRDLERQRPSAGSYLTPRLVSAIRENYYVKFRDVWFIYEPKT